MTRLTQGVAWLLGALVVTAGGWYVVVLPQPAGALLSGALPVLVAKTR